LAIASSLAVFFSKVIDFVLEDPASLTLEKLEVGLLGTGKDQL